MQRMTLIVLTPALLVALVVSSAGQVKKGKTRAAHTKQIMAGLVQTNCAAAGKALKEGPADDKAWTSLATHAALLNEASYLVMDDGRCPDAEWAKAAKALREASAELLAKVEAKDAAGAQQSFTSLTQACSACHKAHRQQKTGG